MPGGESDPSESLQPHSTLPVLQQQIPFFAAPSGEPERSTGPAGPGARVPVSEPEIQKPGVTSQSPFEAEAEGVVDSEEKPVTAYVHTHFVPKKVTIFFAFCLPKISPFWRAQVGIESVSEMANIFPIFIPKFSLFQIHF